MPVMGLDESERLLNGAVRNLDATDAHRPGEQALAYVGLGLDDAASQPAGDRFVEACGRWLVGVRSQDLLL